MHGGDDDTSVQDEEDAPHSDDKANLSQGTLSLPDISASNNEDAHKAIACEAAQKSNVQYGNWRDEQIRQGDDNISQWDKMTHDYAKVRKTSKTPDNISPPLTYMEEHGAFKPLDTMANPLGLCQFYCAQSGNCSLFQLQSPQLPLIKLSTCWKRPGDKGSLIS